MHLTSFFCFLVLNNFVTQKFRHPSGPDRIRQLFSKVSPHFGKSCGFSKASACSEPSSAERCSETRRVSHRTPDRHRNENREIIRKCEKETNRRRNTDTPRPRLKRNGKTNYRKQHWKIVEQLLNENWCLDSQKMFQSKVLFKKKLNSEQIRRRWRCHVPRKKGVSPTKMR